MPKPDSTHDIVYDETNNQNQGKGADAGTRKKMGPAASHQAGNPTTGGGINRPTKGRV